MSEDNINSEHQDFIRAALDAARSRLLDKTRRNRLLNFKEAARDVPIIDEMPDQVFEHLVVHEKKFYFDYLEKVDGAEREALDLFEDITEEPDRTLPISRHHEHNVENRYIDDRLQTPFNENDLERRLRLLYREHRAIIEETGANNLHLAIGFLRWYDRTDSDIAYLSPLVLLPVRLRRIGTIGDATYSLFFDDEALDTNYSLFEKLRQDFDITLPMFGDDQSPESYISNVEGAIRSKIKDRWEIVREMTLGLFRFQKQVMWHDLNPDRWPDQTLVLDHAILKRILYGREENELPPGQLIGEYDQDDLEGKNDTPQVPLVLDADSSQYTALVDSLQQKEGLVIEGPPGTGKSQTITNLIAAALSEGKRILFVAEKMAALDVVFKRLEKVGLAPFCLQLHGLKTNKKELLESIATRMKFHPHVPKNINQKYKQLQTTKKELIGLSQALQKKVGPDSLPLHDVVWRVEKLIQRLSNEFEPLSVSDVETIDISQFHETKNLLNGLGIEWDAIDKEARDAWSGFLPDTGIDNKINTIKLSITDGLVVINEVSDWLNSHGIVETAPSILEVIRLYEIGNISPNVFQSTDLDKVNIILLYNVVHFDLLHEYENIVPKIENYLNTVLQVNEVFDFRSEDAIEHTRLLKRHGKKLISDICTSSTRIADLPREQERLEGIIVSLSSLKELINPLVELTNEYPRTLDDYLQAAITAKELSSGPAELSLHASSFHLKQSALLYYEKASDNFRELARYAATHLKLFKIERAESTSELQDAQTVLKDNIGNWFSIFSRDYRDAKRLIKSVLRNPKNFKCNLYLVEELKGLIEYCIRRDKFGNDVDYKTVLGTLFRGIDTDWNVLEQVIVFSRSLNERFGTEKAQQIFSDWDTYSQTMENVSIKVRNVHNLINEYIQEKKIEDKTARKSCEEMGLFFNNSLTLLREAINELILPWCTTTATLKNAINASDGYHLALHKEKEIENNEHYSTLIQPCWNKSMTDFNVFKDSLDWLKEKMSLKGMNLEILRWVISCEKTLRIDEYTELHNRAKNIRSFLSQQIKLLESSGTVDIIKWVGNKKSRIVDFREKLTACVSHISILASLAKWKATYNRVCKKGYKTLADQVETEVLIGQKCGEAYEYCIYNSLLKKNFDETSQLSDFNQARHEEIQRQFSDLDREIFKNQAEIIAAQLCTKTIPEGVGRGRVANYTDSSLLRNEISKKRRHIPIRQLIKRASTALQSLKPCFLMSPLSVAQYLPPGNIHFDLVVMDEASQLRPEDALGAIVRAGTAVVVGDPKQLPPTSFFFGGSFENEENEETVLEDTESILDVCLKKIPFRRLRWHYRSEHESLIKFSNERFYDGDLIVFPSPKPGSREYGVHFNYVEEPSYRNGRNRAEALLVVEKIIEHYQISSDKSLGVAAFNRKQAEDIQLLLDQAAAKDPVIDELLSKQLGNEDLFIKNLENVQGDERDVIIISTTYGPDKAGGNVYQRFGPINSNVGWRRLNVIITRARKRVEVVSSMRPSDIRIGPNTSKGARSLREYIEYASNDGRVKEHGENTGKDYDNEFEEAIANVVKDLGYDVDPQVGVTGFFIDLGVHHPDRPGEYLLGIECDGATYHSSRSVRDRDRLRQDILKDKGWDIHRIWSTSWFHAREVEIAKLKKVLETALEEDRSRNAEFIQSGIPEIETEILTTKIQDQIDDERENKEQNLESALNRFWIMNIKPLFPNRSTSILSNNIILHIVDHKPETKEMWLNIVPIELREKINTKEGEYLGDILDIVSDYI